MNAISHAAQKNNVDIVEYLIQNGVDPNEIDTVSCFLCCSASYTKIHFT